jgi:NAD(P)-dependent dehydrogenase (short-subunit alcohol dehydrogenase family)
LGKENGMAGQLQGKVAIVTGGASGIGEGMVKRFVAEGAKVVIADLDQALGEALQKELGANAAFKKTDVSDAKQVAELVDFAIKTYGGLHALVNNAGVPSTRTPSLLEDDLSDFDRVMKVNLLGVMVGTREAARHMSKNGGGSVVNVTSIGGINPSPGMWSYGASKAAVGHFTRSAAVELGPMGIRCNLIAPGNIETPIMAKTVAAGLPPKERDEMMAKVRAFLLGRQPIQIQGVPEDTAQAALYLISDASRYVTGMTIPVDGGQLCGSPQTGGGFKDAVKR